MISSNPPPEHTDQFMALVHLPAPGCMRPLKQSGDGALCGKSGGEGPLCCNRPWVEAGRASGLGSRLLRSMGEPLCGGHWAPKSSYKNTFSLQEVQKTKQYITTILNALQKRIYSYFYNNTPPPLKVSLTNLKNRLYTHSKKPRYKPGICSWAVEQAPGLQAVASGQGLRIAEAIEGGKGLGKGANKTSSRQFLQSMSLGISVVWLQFQSVLDQLQIDSASTKRCRKL